MGMDAWHKSNVHSYPVFVLSYTTENIQGGIAGVAVCDTNSADHYEAFLKTMLTLIRAVNPTKEFKPLSMVDNDKAEIAAVKKCGLEPILCKWHLIKGWKKKAAECYPNDTDMQRKVATAMILMFNTNSEPAFKRRLEELGALCGNNSKYYKYIEKEYATKCK